MTTRQLFREARAFISLAPPSAQRDKLLQQISEHGRRKQPRRFYPAKPPNRLLGVAAAVTYLSLIQREVTPQELDKAIHTANEHGTHTTTPVVAYAAQVPSRKDRRF